MYPGDGDWVRWQNSELRTGDAMNAMAELATGSGLTSVVVTGAAMTTALATDVQATWKGLLDGQSGIRRLDDEFIDEFAMPVRIGGHLLEDFDELLTRVELRRFLYLQKISTVIGRRVWADAGAPEVDTDRLLVSIGTGMGSTEEFVRVSDDIRVRGIRAISPLGVQQAMPNAAAAAVGLERGAKAGIFTPVSACASGAQAIALAWRNIVLGEADMAICGGVETKIEAIPIAAFAQQDLLSTNKNPTEAQIRVAMNGHLCRCGTYPKILKAIQQAGHTGRITAAAPRPAARAPRPAARGPRLVAPGPRAAAVAAWVRSMNSGWSRIAESVNWT